VFCLQLKIGITNVICKLMIVNIVLHKIGITNVICKLMIVNIVLHN
jgi:hypothetical protein